MNTDPSELRPEVITGEVVVAKNPCFHPGDVRKLRVRLFWAADLSSTARAVLGHHSHFLLTCLALLALSGGALHASGLGAVCKRLPPQVEIHVLLVAIAMRNVLLTGQDQHTRTTPAHQ